MFAMRLIKEPHHTKRALKKIQRESQEVCGKKGRMPEIVAKEVL
jgi:hypothetical protein